MLSVLLTVLQVLPAQDSAALLKKAHRAEEHYETVVRTRAPTSYVRPRVGRCDEVIGRLKADYRIQMDHALLLGKILQRGIRIIVASPSIDAAIVRKLFLTPAATPQEALEMALKMVRKRKPTVLFFPQAQRTLPIFNNTPK